LDRVGVLRRNLLFDPLTGVDMGLGLGTKVRAPTLKFSPRDLEGFNFGEEDFFHV